MRNMDSEEIRIKKTKITFREPCLRESQPRDFYENKEEVKTS